jgi:nitrite reductase/ring-hydroxylating ferredoxin subunit
VSAAARPRALCRLDELADPGSRGFAIEGEEIFIVRRGRLVAGYVNSCPHTRGPLDWVPDQFLDLERRHILCATHGALFRIEDGHCLAGPCVGDKLTAVAVEIVDGVVVLRR